jgi:predicted Zn-dependent protease
VIGQLDTTANLRWANNTVTTNGVGEKATLSIVSIIGRRVGSVTRTYFPPERLEEMVRESEAACRRRPDAPDFMPLLEGTGMPSDWGAVPPETDGQVLAALVPPLGTMFERARRSDVATFGYAEHGVSTVWLGMSTGLFRRHSDRIGKVEITAKTPDFKRSTWTGAATRDFRDVDPLALLDSLERRLGWAERKSELAPGQYEVLLESSCAADLAIAAYDFMARRDADEGRSPYSKPGGTRIGEQLFGDVTMFSDPRDPDVAALPFHAGVESGGFWSVFDNGLTTSRTEWVRNGELQALITPRYWAAKVGLPAASPYIGNLIVSGNGPTIEEMIAQTDRALLVTCFWYIRTVDPQTALQTGLTRDGVFLVERGQVKGAVNNFRWNMSPIASLAQATQIGHSRSTLPREHDEFLRVKAPPLRIARFNMSSASEAT